MSLLKRVMAQTSGAACRLAEDRLVPFAEDALDAVDRELVGSHLARCPACRQELAHVRAILADLPLIAEAATDPAFVEDVLRRTSQRPRWTEAWRRLVLRPRFALELAYVGAVVLCVVGTFTDLHVRELPGKMRTMISDLKENP